MDRFSAEYIQYIYTVYHIKSYTLYIKRYIKYKYIPIYFHSFYG